MVSFRRKCLLHSPQVSRTPKYSNRVYKLSKALYGLKEAPRAWYARLKTFLLEHGYMMGSVDKTFLLLNMAMTSCSDLRR
jgi:hypothetical protein